MEAIRAILLVLGVIWTVFGVSLIIYTEKTRSLYREWISPEVARRFAIPAMVIGAILILGAFFSGDIFWLPFVLGLIALSKGIFLWKAPPEKTEMFLNRWLTDSSEETARFFGLATFCLGCVLLAYLL